MLARVEARSLHGATVIRSAEIVVCVPLEICRLINVPFRF